MDKKCKIVKVAKGKWHVQDMNGNEIELPRKEFGLDGVYLWFYTFSEAEKVVIKNGYEVANPHMKPREEEVAKLIDESKAELMDIATNHLIGIGYKSYVPVTEVNRDVLDEFKKELENYVKLRIEASKLEEKWQ